MKLTIPVKLSEAQKRFLVYPEMDTVGAIKEWLYLHAGQKEYYYDKFVGAYLVKTSLLQKFKQAFNIDVKDEDWKPDQK